MNENYAKILEKKLVKELDSSFILRNKNRTLRLLHTICSINYDYEWRYTFPSIEDKLKKISATLTKRPVVGVSNRVVFYDAFSIDNRGLTQQYIDALIANDFEFLYISRREKSAKNNRICDKISNYSKASFLFFNSGSSIELAQGIYDAIIDYAPELILMQMAPDDVSAVVAFNALPASISRFQINLTDHGFWIGVYCCDYVLEFRQYGCDISRTYRGISDNKQLLLPFYPYIDSSQDFEGFPFSIDDKIVLLSGGALYKIKDKNLTLLNLIKKILVERKNVICIFVGGGDSKFLSDFIERESLQKQFFFLGQRKDINEVIKRCHIYINTYPMGGGLMCQYAAKNAKPVISFSSTQRTLTECVESIVCQSSFQKITYVGEEAFISEVFKLIDNACYRDEKGIAMHECVIPQSVFNDKFYSAIRNKETGLVIKKCQTNLPTHYNVHMNSDNITRKRIVKNLGWLSILYCPHIVFECLFGKLKSFNL